MGNWGATVSMETGGRELFAVGSGEGSDGVKIGTVDTEGVKKNWAIKGYGRG